MIHSAQTETAHPWYKHHDHKRQHKAARAEPRRRQAPQNVMLLLPRCRRPPPQFNSIEKTWDCPCHGSHFEGSTGKVINGPAKGDLDPVEW